MNREESSPQKYVISKKFSLYSHLTMLPFGSDHKQSVVLWTSLYFEVKYVTRMPCKAQCQALALQERTA